MNSYKLNNGVAIPEIGFGTWQLTENVEQVIHWALNAGYTHIDTAAAYKNEKEIAEAIKTSGKKRSDLFLTTKVWASERGCEKAKNAIETSLANLETDVIDLMLIHWPAKTSQENWEEENEQTWKALEEYYAQGKIRAIGVSNFMVHHLEALLKTAKVKPMVNQIEYHPGYLQEDAVAFCKEHDILVEAWSPIGSGRILEDQLLNDLAKKYNTNVGAICIQFCLQNGILPLPKSTSQKNIENNIQINFQLDNEDMVLIKNMPQTGWSGLNPDEVPF